MNRKRGGRSSGRLAAIRNRAIRLVMAFAVAVGGWGASLSATPVHAAGQALINGDTVSGGASSLEATEAAADGFTVTVVTGAQWDTMTAAQFAAFQVLIIGDPTCDTMALSATSNAAVWAPVVMGTAGGNTQAGNRVLIGTDPVFHHFAHPGATKLIKDGIAFAGALAGRTGLYLDFSCSDNGQGLATLNMLSIGTGVWTENISPPCGGSVSLIASNPAFSDLTSADLQGWFCSDHETFPTSRNDWLPLAVATDTPTHPTCGTDHDTGAAVCGEAYIYLAGVGVTAAAPNICLTPATATDPAGGSHTVTAHVQTGTSPACPAGPGVSGQLVSFTVTGQNAGASGTCSPVTCMTDSSGNVTFTYSDTNGPGTDTINASFTDSSGTKQTTTATKTWVAGADTIPPTCALTSATDGPPAQIVVTVQDADDGLGTVTTSTTNATAVVDPFVAGTKNPVNITATKIDQTTGATLEVVATDVSGNQTICDPAVVNDGTGKPTHVTIGGSEGKVAIANSGLSSITIEVNGKKFSLRGIDSQTNLTLDISSALTSGSNAVTIHGKGSHGTTALVVFSS